ncbi:MAG: Thiosulfate sulfurtransferase GlpE [Alphaproteobacteria bacterium MarineAlpha3_Bin5]|nr:hypothetical protein [Magnetovibrio sp.]PPR79654.1 MAG: Thiosulfate sulfurtransferase GlpE [Alphaproteobacteria bacterium MarineAlpha3_Bin5]
MFKLIDSSPQEVKRWLDENEAILVDIRESQELTEAKVAGAIHLPLSEFNPSEIPNEPGKKTVLICGHGVRSRQVGNFLLERGFLEKAYHVSTGIAGWQNAGLQTDTA